MEYEVAVGVTVTVYMTVYAEDEEDAKDQAAEQWSYSDLQNGEVTDVQVLQADGKTYA